MEVSRRLLERMMEVRNIDSSPQLEYFLSFSQRSIPGVCKNTGIYHPFTRVTQNVSLSGLICSDVVSGLFIMRRSQTRQEKM